MRAPTLFKVVLAASLVIRLYLAIFTDGTTDITIWEQHAENIHRIGLTEYYRLTINDQWTFNHPPFAGKLVEAIFVIGKTFNIPFKIIFRLLFSAIDYLIAFYIYKLLAADKNRFFYVGFYLINPITFIFSAYHGNTDTSLGLFILLSVYFLSRQKMVSAGIAFGLGTWVKWIILLALPALFFAVPNNRAKIRLIAAMTITSLLGYSWCLLNAPKAMIDSVFGYTGQLIQTTAGIPVWGNRIVVGWLQDLVNPGNGGKLIDAILSYNSIIIIIVVTLYSWLRRHREGGIGLGRTVGEVFIIFYGLSNYWAFQYLVWCSPFLVFISLPLAALIACIYSGYICALYSLVCGSCFLLGKWDFVGHPGLSATVLFFRNSSIILSLALTFYFFGSTFPEKYLKESTKY